MLSSPQTRICGYCRKPVSGSSRNVQGKIFCEEHFICKTCHKPIKGNFYFRDEKLTCFDCVPKCLRCGKPVSGKVATVRALGGEFHSSCFVCSVCGVVCLDSFVCGDGQIFCSQHGISQDSMNALSNRSKSNPLDSNWTVLQPNDVPNTSPTSNRFSPTASRKPSTAFPAEGQNTAAARPSTAGIRKQSVAFPNEVQKNSPTTRPSPTGSRKPSVAFTETGVEPVRKATRGSPMIQSIDTEEQSTIPTDNLPTDDGNISTSSVEALLKEIEILQKAIKEKDDMLALKNKESKEDKRGHRTYHWAVGSLSRTMKQIHLRNVDIHEKIADGGSCASIYACTVDGWSCVMKQLDTEKVDEVTANQFIHEIEVLERLPYSPYICRYLFHERKGSIMRLFISRYHTNLRYMIERRKSETGLKFDRAHVALWASQIAAGIDFLHMNNIVHRDIKTNNVLVHMDRRSQILKLVIADFDTSYRITKNDQPNDVVGTSSYTAPEVFMVKTNGPYGFSADIWSFGMVLLEMMTLKRPYESIRDRFKIPEAIIAGQRPSTDELGPEWRDLISIYQGCTQSDPNARPSPAALRLKLFFLYNQWS